MGNKLIADILRGGAFVKRMSSIGSRYEYTVVLIWNEITEKFRITDHVYDNEGKNVDENSYEYENIDGAIKQYKILTGLPL